MGRVPVPKLPRKEGRRPLREELLDLMESLEIVLSDIMRRWDDGGVQPELRAEIMTTAYEPLLRMLIRARRRPVPR